MREKETGERGCHKPFFSNRLDEGITMRNSGFRAMSILLDATALGGISIGLGYRGSLEAINKIARKIGG